MRVLSCFTHEDVLWFSNEPTRHGEFWVHQIVCLVTAIAQDWGLLLHDEEIFTLGPLGITVSIIVWPDAV